MIRIEGRAPAKINLHLYVGWLRTDGFHEIHSLFQRISLSDQVKIDFSPWDDSLQNPAKQSLSIRLQTAYGVSPEKDLIYRSVVAFCRAAKITGTFIISCVKHIPLNSGLGGGSSDAATTLILLNELFGFPLNQVDLVALGAGIGSDVPFFLYPDGAAAVVSGRGECVSPIWGGRKGYVVLASTGHRKLSTGSAFSVLDRLRSEVGIPPDPYISELDRVYREDHLSTWRFINSFQPVLELEDPDFCKLLEDFSRTRPDFLSLTGSGPWVFGIYSTREQAEDGQTALDSLRYATILTELG